MRIEMQEELTHVGAMNNMWRIWALLIRAKKNHDWMLSIVCVWSVGAKPSDRSCSYNDNPATLQKTDWRAPEQMLEIMVSY